ncbi:MAG: glycosyltransferase family 1 protein [Gemmatimonadaceae bacterium]
MNAPRPIISVAFDEAHERQSDAGIARCAGALAAALSAREDIELIRLGGGTRLSRGTLKKRLATLRQDFFWYPYAGRRSARNRAAQVYHCPSPRAPLSAGTPPLVVTVHDLAVIRFPETLTPWSRVYERAMLPRVVDAADRIIAVSRDTSADLQTLLGVPASKIRVIPNGVDASLFAPKERERPFPFPYVLFVGTPQPRKNLGRLASAVKLLSTRGQLLRLVIAGSEGWGEIEMDRSDVTFTGHVSHQRLRALYQHAECLALVSLHEGFGLPALEAMVAGTPVVGARAGAIPEVTGGAAVLVDPLDIESIAAGIIEATDRRSELVLAGRRRAADFSWTNAAELTVAVYHELA